MFHVSILKYGSFNVPASLLHNLKQDLLQNCSFAAQMYDDCGILVQHYSWFKSSRAVSQNIIDC